MFNQEAEFVNISKSTNCINAMLVGVSSTNNASIFKLPSSEIDRFFITYDKYLKPIHNKIYQNYYNFNKNITLVIRFCGCESNDDGKQLPHSYTASSYEIIEKQGFNN